MKCEMKNHTGRLNWKLRVAMQNVIRITRSDYTKPWIGWQRRQGELASRQLNLGWLFPRYGLRMRSVHSRRGCSRI